MGLAYLLTFQFDIQSTAYESTLIKIIKIVSLNINKFKLDICSCTCTCIFKHFVTITSCISKFCWVLIFVTNLQYSGK